MEAVIEKYFSQHLDNGAKPYYNKMAWYNSIVVGATSTIIIQVIPSELIQFIWVSKLAVDFTGLGGPVTFVDPAEKTTLFTWQNTISGFNIYNLDYIKYSNSITFICSDPAINFSIGIVKVTSQKINE